VLWGRDNSVAKARNTIAAEALRQGADWIWWLDDDLIFRPETLLKALERPEEIVIGLSLSRTKIGGDFRPIWSNVEMQGDRWFPVTQIVREANGLMRLTHGTAGGVLMHRPAFECVEAMTPNTRGLDKDGQIRPVWWAMGQLVPDMFWEDIHFYDKLRAAGFDIWGDPEVKFGHDTKMTIWPYEAPDGQWHTVLAHGFEPWILHSWDLPRPVVPAESELSAAVHG